MKITAGPRASGGTFALRVGPSLKLEFAKDKPTDVPDELEYESVITAPGPDRGKRIKKKVDGVALLQPYIDQGYLTRTDVKPPPSRRKQSDE